MAAPQLKKTQGNSASTTLSSGVASGDTSAPLTADTNFAGEGMVVISEGEAVEEFAYATAKAGGALTIPLANRGEEGGSAQTHASGATVKGILTAGMWNDLIDQILVEHDDDGTHDAITATSVNLVSGGSGNVTNTSLFTNALINGNMDVWQRGTSFTASANNDDVYTADRWNLISDGNDAVDITQSTDKPDGSMYSMKLDTETAKRYGVVQFIENIDSKKLDNKTVSLSFAAKTTSSQVTTLRAAVLTWGSTADAVTSDVVGTWADTPTWATNWTAENTPADITITDSWATYKVENIAIDTATVNNIAVVIWTPNEETIGDVWYLSQVQLNEGSVALPFQPKSFAQELADCQRYYYHIQGSAGALYTRLGTGQCFSATTCGIYIPFPVTMRTNPTLVQSGDYGVMDPTGVSINGTSISITATADGLYGAQVDIGVAAGLTAGHANMGFIRNSATAYVGFLAEL